MSCKAKIYRTDEISARMCYNEFQVAKRAEVRPIPHHGTGGGPKVAPAENLAGNAATNLLEANCHLGVIHYGTNTTGAIDD